MSLERWPQVSRVLDEVLEHPPAEWPGLVRRLCGGDAELRREVEGLLAGYSRVDGFLEEPPRALAAEAIEHDAGPAGLTVGPYRVVRLIARGGMGRVMLADRVDGAFTQRVALKLLRPGADTPDAAWRFRTERQILATLDHPNIAHLLDGGVTADGQPWLAMEYVEGLPIDRYCDAHGLTIAQRLELVLTIAGAVQYAHRNLVIHRDLKPSNILVTAEGLPKLLDFGIAKLLADHGDRAVTTRPGQRWMTPAYAAPEQVRGEAATTATDVYQLGAVLYELLTGRRPFAHTDGLQAVEEAVLTQDPLRPSLAAAPPARPSPFARALRGDLDAIVLHALQKAPDRRYGSAQVLSDDLRSYLAGTPVEARESTLGYRAGRFVTRHRVGVAIAAAFLAVLMGSAVMQAVQQSATARERDRARAEAEKSARVTEFLMGLFAASDPGRARGDTITARELLERGVIRADSLADQPLIQAMLLGVTGRVYANLGDGAQAGALLRRAVAIQRAQPAPDSSELDASLYTLASVLARDNHFVAAESAYRELIELRARRVGEGDPSSLSVLFDLGMVLHGQGKREGGDSLFRAWEARLAELPHSADPDVARSQFRLAQILGYQGEHERAERLFRQALATQREVFGPRYPNVGETLNALAGVLLAAEKIEPADSVTREALTLLRDLYPDGHTQLTLATMQRADLLRLRKRYAESEALIREVLARDEGAGLRDLGWAYHASVLGDLQLERGLLAEAEDVYRQVYRWWVDHYGGDYLITARRGLQLGAILRERGNYPAAEALLVRSYDALRPRGADDRHVREALGHLVRLYEAWGRPDRAAAYDRLLTPPGD